MRSIVFSRVQKVPSEALPTRERDLRLASLAKDEKGTLHEDVLAIAPTKITVFLSYRPA